jgi:hypothetical protein
VVRDAPHGTGSAGGPWRNRICRRVCRCRTYTTTHMLQIVVHHTSDVRDASMLTYVLWIHANLYLGSACGSVTMLHPPISVKSKRSWYGEKSIEEKV